MTTPDHDHQDDQPASQPPSDDADGAPEVEQSPLRGGGSGAGDDEELVGEFAHYEGVDEELAGDQPSPPKERLAAAMRLEAKVEAIIFAAQKPLKAQDIQDVLQDPGVSEQDVQRTLDELVEFYNDRGGGFRLHYLKRLGYQFQTSEDAGAIMERMFASRPRPISRAALETLAIIAYRQPVTRAEVEFIRGVDAGSIFKTLLERELIKCVGRKEIVGRPMLFGTSEQFLTVFNLSSIKDLPSLESFQPARDMVQGAMARIDAGADEDLVDVEEYIADSTRGEYEGDDLGLGADIGASSDDQPVENSGDGHGTDADSEVAVAAGDSLPAGSRDLEP